MSPETEAQLCQTLAMPLNQRVEKDVNRLAKIERRLGTHKEKRSDFEKARTIAHRLRNMQMILGLSRAPHAATSHAAGNASDCDTTGNRASR